MAVSGREPLRPVSWRSYLGSLHPILYRMAQAACNARGEDAAVQLLFERQHFLLRPRIDPENPTPENPTQIRADELMSRYSVDHHSFTVSDMNNGRLMEIPSLASDNLQTST